MTAFNRRPFLIKLCQEKSYMKDSSSGFLGVLSPARVGLASAVAAIMLGAPVPRLAAQSADFNAGNDTGWTRYCH